MVYDVRPEDEILGFAAVIREGADEPLEIYGYSYSPWRSGLYRVLCALTLGLLPLVTSWKPEWYVQMSCTPCQLSRATVLVVKDSHFRLNITEVKTYSLNHRRLSLSNSYQRRKRTFTLENETQTHLRGFVHQHLRYIWSPQESRFARLSGLDRGWKCVDLIQGFQGYSMEEQQEQSLLYGRNAMELEVKSVATLLFEKVSHPFYVFQIASIIVWMLDLYYFYAGCIIAFSVTSITLALHEAKKQMQHLVSLVSRTNEGTAMVVRANNEVEEVPSAHLVPGDIICVPTSGCLMTCDAVLTAGNCLVNESLLTGFSTAKGALVRSILFAQPAPFRFYRDAILFVLLLCAVASLGMAYTLYLYVIRQSG